MRQNFLSSAISDISAYIRLADTKVSIIMAAVVAILARLLTCYEPTGFCEADHARTMGYDFWQEHLENAISAGGEIGKSERTVKQDVSYIMVDIYCAPELYDLCSVVKQKKEDTV